MRKALSKFLLKYPVIPADVKNSLRILYNTAEVKRAGLRDNYYQKRYPYLPPASLRKRVSGTTDVASFINSGVKNSQELTSAIKRHGLEWKNFASVLDFGCGCSRVLTHLRDEATKLYGTDSDAKAIEWCQKNLGFATFSANSDSPPTNYPSQFFDMIYGISVFTHLDEVYQFKWLQELERISSGKSMLLLTVMGDYAASLNVFTEPEKRSLAEKGFVHRSYRESFPFPVCYGDTYHTKEYVYKNWSRYFRVVDYIERGINNHQDIVVLRKNLSN